MFQTMTLAALQDLRGLLSAERIDTYSASFVRGELHEFRKDVEAEIGARLRSTESRQDACAHRDQVTTIDGAYCDDCGETTA